ncbi:hypothetical protein TrRE_jg2153 [Triparma retinervis]|uniref:Serine carboxypeptidase n=1 Tax=Triparma retinervis TaxID=2557542 RepID=A0A9W7CLU8_9STRA|nr:hypothetical protein TrRE_jg2153 [Triparma retinervis]
MFVLSSLLLLGALAAVGAAPAEDLVTNLPGYGALPFPMYSGFLSYTMSTGKQVNTHYILSQQMEGEYDEDKLIFWSNGGPGASSMFGFMTEVGPFSLNANSLTTDEMSTKTYDTIKETCGGEDVLKHPLAFGGLSPSCSSLLSALDSEIGGYYEYALYDDCTYQNGLLKTKARPKHTAWRGDVEGALNDYTCGGGEVMEDAPWRPWTLDGCARMGGYATGYEGGAFEFVTVRGAGHMTPTYKPEASFEMFRTWIMGEERKKYVKGCEEPDL